MGIAAGAARQEAPEEPARFVLAGAPIGNGNRGVEALGRSVVDAVQRDAPLAHLTILDDEWGIRAETSGRYDRISVELAGVRRSRRWHRPESWAHIRFAQAVSTRLNPVAQRFAEADVVLDVSAGDSFTDLYGTARLHAVCAPKAAAVRGGRPLVLLPQTYGPFRSSEARALAGRLIRAATVAYARDPWSHAQLLELAGPDADPTRLRDGVDVAFALEPRRPADRLASELEELAGEDTAGVNVSGLLQGPEAHARFGLAGDYFETAILLVRQLVGAGARVVLVPHVHGHGGEGESDIHAIHRVLDALTDAERDRTCVLPPELDASELKWCIATLDWFVGSRMHATIAALSTTTPAAAYAYSDKTRGVFETCGLGDQVVDARACYGHEAVERLVAGWHDRAHSRAVLADRGAATVERSRTQLQEVLQLGARALPPARRVRVHE
ncbi:polysaccharide pyruvyl transferase family protein [Nocardioides xinjiangensis]|uniref:polysaccharide pyruvyl transferase family protein n=1 Tax=Nocardioides xinjiangensis TaxID=2817376 RepID=UPI001B31892A|nr:MULTISPECIES: polysaccharide pyruvyl transferase family protein [unclassified Nocardioides]